MTSAVSSLRKAWEALGAELDLWTAEGLTARFWWRDDDAVDVTPELEQLLAIQRAAAVPLTLAIVPGQATRALADRLETLPGITVAQHGLAHINHAPPHEKKSEFPGARVLTARLEDLHRGREIMKDLFPRQALQMLVPPWNRLSPDALEHLPSLGFFALSSFQLRQRYWAAPGLIQLNAHIDPVDWHGGHSDAGPITALATAVRTLIALRSGAAPQQTLGLLTHHLRHDIAGWDFVSRFLDYVTRHRAARWVGLDEALAFGRPAADVMPRS